ncbi:HIT family protein [Cupriavidus plantarum]|uniref:HIT family protein n=1 Tax=Cupriavidus plantarum TaxID=942865 RepID=UPI000EB38B1D|nr:HIT family protein [Cupriavidus plantarum]NYI02454.1 diadenosine tetraphosphate (Ap4A) HIT family hydrolase [Cupriavidus plantarum]RLK30163.1 diadenosine tetraphosphate (Ap4A) HIT family hydrolase [Cupriavidus plantarum]
MDSFDASDQNCIFCQVVRGTAPCHTIWEDAHHVAFLSIYAYTPGFAVLVTKAHYRSNLAELDAVVIDRLIEATKVVRRMLDRIFRDVGRTGCDMGGFGVDHAHVKFYVEHGCAGAH